MMSIITSPGYLFALGVTVAIEVPLVALAFPGERLKMAACALVATTLTHLGMHLVTPISPEALMTWLIVGETAAVVLEGLAYWAVTNKRGFLWAMGVSIIANAASFSAGFLF